jgi:hypothetical protein
LESLLLKSKLDISYKPPEHWFRKKCEMNMFRPQPTGILPIALTILYILSYKNIFKIK